MTSLPTNVSFACAAKSLTGLAALVLPASDELVTMQGAPIGKLFTVAFNTTHAELEEGDKLTNEADATDAYRIKSVKQVGSPRLAHTHCFAEKGLA
jgi:hypothetical protein